MKTSFSYRVSFLSDEEGRYSYGVPMSKLVEDAFVSICVASDQASQKATKKRKCAIKSSSL